MDDNDVGLARDILQRYADPATVEFDRVLAIAGVPDDVARALRFWQRESVANVKQFAAATLPAVFAVLRTAQRDASDTTLRAGAMLDRPRRITLPDAPVADAPIRAPLEERRRTVAASLQELG
jgi:hypothetical protein